MKDFWSWLDSQGRGETEEVDDVVYFTCGSCGRTEFFSLSEYENGDTGWYSEDPESGEGLCGGPFCLP